MGGGPGAGVVREAVVGTPETFLVLKTILSTPKNYSKTLVSAPKAINIPKGVISTPQKTLLVPTKLLVVSKKTLLTPKELF